MRNPPIAHNRIGVQWEPEGSVFSWLAAYARSHRQHPAKVRLIRAIERRLYRKIIRHSDGGGRLHIDGSEYIGWSLLTRGVFEPVSISLAIELMRPGGVFVDIGANRGLFSIAVGAATGCSVVAVEPAQENFRNLLENLRLNPSIRVTAVNCCASPQNSLLQLCAGEAGHSAWTKVRRGEHSASQPYVAGLTLDLILQQLHVSSVVLLKIDVEGYELEVFRGLDWSGPGRPRHVIMECNTGEHDKIRFLCERGYTARTVFGDPLPNTTDFPEGNLHFSDTHAQPGSATTSTVSKSFRSGEAWQE